MPYLASSLSFAVLAPIAAIVIAGILVFYALRTKGDVFAEFVHGKTTIRIDARDKRKLKG